MAVVSKKLQKTAAKALIAAQTRRVNEFLHVNEFLPPPVSVRDWDDHGELVLRV